MNLVQKTKHKNALFFYPNFTFIILSINSCQQIVSNYELKIENVTIVDGDTFKDCKNVKYRLIGIDTPESYNCKNNIQKRYGNLAKEYLEHLIKNNWVNVLFVSQDKYNRKVVRAYNVDKLDLSISLIKKGLAKVSYISKNRKSPFFYDDFNYINNLLIAQTWAQNHNLGIWSNVNKINLIFPQNN